MGIYFNREIKLFPTSTLPSCYKFGELALMTLLSLQNSLESLQDLLVASAPATAFIC